MGELTREAAPKEAAEEAPTVSSRARNGSAAHVPAWSLLIQPKLLIGGEDDPLEREADRVAAAVTSPTSHIPSAEPAGAGSAATFVPTAEAQADVEKVLHTPGRSLEVGTRDFMESRFRRDFSDVRVHDDADAASSARGVHAIAYTSGSHIVLGAGCSPPATPEGQRLIAHELAHVVQQTGLHNAAEKNPEVHVSGPVGALQAASGLTMQRQKAPGSLEGQKPPGLVIEAERIGGTGMRRVEAELLRLGVLTPSDYDSIGFLGNGYYFAASSGSGESFRHFRVVDAIEIRNEADSIAGYRIISYLHPAAQAPQPGPGAPSKPPTNGPGTPAVEPTKPTGKAAGDSTKAPTNTKPASDPQPKPAALGDAIAPETLRTEFAALPEVIKDLLLPGGKQYSQTDLPQLLRIAAKLKQLRPEDLALYKLLAKELAENLDAFERSVDTFVQFKARIDAEATAEKKTAAKANEHTLEEKLSKTWGQFDESKFGSMSTGQKEDVAREVAAEQRNISLEHLATHPGETAVGMAEGMVRLDKTAKAIADDVKEAADGSKGAYTRLAGAVGAYNKYVAAAASIVFVALLFVPGVNLLELAAAGLAVAAATIVLSVTESELRIKAAGEAKTPEDFKTQTGKSAAAQTQAVMAAAMLALTLVAKIVARIPLPGRYQNVGSALKAARTALLDRSGVGPAWRSVKADLVARLRAAKKGLPEALAEQTKAMSTTAKAVEGMSGDQFIQHLADGDPQLADLGISPDQAKATQKLGATPEGKNVAEQLRRSALQGLEDAPVEATAKVDRFLKAVDDSIESAERAQSPEQLAAAVEDGNKKVGPEEQARQAVADEEGFVAKRAKGARRSAIREQAQKKLGALQGERIKTQAEIVRLEKELSDATVEVNRLKQKALEAPVGSEGRTAALKELNRAKEALAELREADELGGYREERAKQEAAEEAILQSLELKRPSLWQSTKDAIKKAAKKNAMGQYLDANTGEAIPGEPVYGHKYGREHRRLVLEASAKGMTQEQFNAWVNEHPDWFQTETKASNESHRFEKPGVD